MQIKEIEAEQTWEIRLPTLRPNGSLKDCVFEGDDEPSTTHFGCFAMDELVGIVSIYQQDNSEFKGSGYQLRAMATLPKVRGSGAGSKLLQTAESHAFCLGSDYIWANARASAQGFYLKYGYEIYGQQFEVQSVGPHFLMCKLNAV